ncbi:MAG: hypothetical protein ACJ8KX_07530 [Chthoniobacterales bacterium]
MINALSKSATRTGAVLSLAVGLFCLFSPSGLGQTLYGGLGGHNNGDSTNDGALATVNPNTAAVSIVGHPAGVTRISGLAFDGSGVLYGSTLRPGGGFPPPSGPRISDLIRINPGTGATLTSVPITSGAQSLSIADLTIQPGTGNLYGITSPDGDTAPGQLYVINKLTGIATLIGNTGYFFGSIAFAPTGVLFMSAANLNFATGAMIDQALKTIDPNTGATLTSVATRDFFGAFAVRSDGTIFGGTGDEHQLYTIDRVTGAETLIGDTGSNFIGALAFQPVPENGATFGLMALSLLGLIALSQALTLRKVAAVT